MSHTRRIVLPLPPSVNSYWTRGKQFDGTRSMRRSKRAQQFLHDALIAVAMQASPSFGPAPVVVSITIHCRKGYKVGDLDNYNKGLLDALTHARVWDDDDQVVDLTIRRGPEIKGGAAIVDIRSADDQDIEDTRHIDPLVHELRSWGLK